MRSIGPPPSRRSPPCVASEPVHSLVMGNPMQTCYTPVSVAFGNVGVVGGEGEEGGRADREHTTPPKGTYIVQGLLSAPPPSRPMVTGAAIER